MISLSRVTGRRERWRRSRSPSGCGVDGLEFLVAPGGEQLSVAGQSDGARAPHPQTRGAVDGVVAAEGVRTSELPSPADEVVIHVQDVHLRPDGLELRQRSVVR